MCGLDIAEKRLPQDGRFSVKIKDRSIDVRVATMPVQYGESVVMRLLDQDAQLLTFDRLGMPPEMLARFTKLVERSAGMVLVTGPTGSGKTTTLYAALNHLNKAGTKIITVEDPVEYRLDRVNQVQVNPKIGLDFARVLRNVLRQDPDVILVGEMRDRETVEIGLRGAITGHLVFSTLHTMSALATIERLLDMGGAGYMIATAVHAVVAQRLIRRVCDDCGEAVEPTPNQLAWLVSQVGEKAVRRMKFRAGTGCTYCHLTGYRGRTAIYELLEMDRELADLARRGDLEGFARVARTRDSYRPLVFSAIDLAASGVTSLSEAIGVTSGLDEVVDTQTSPVSGEVLTDDAAERLIAS
jgi:MSHA biogenesis protein MshE